MSRTPNKGRLAALLALLAFVVLGLTAVQAANTNTQGVVRGLPPLVISVDGTSAVCTDSDFTSSSKATAVIACVVSGQEVNLLVRVQKAANGLYVDVVTGSTLANLTTNAGSMNLSGRSHPSPTVDAVDTANLTAAQN